MLEEVALKRRNEKSAEIEGRLQKACAETIREACGDMNGFALVAWERNGTAISTFWTGEGPVSRSLVPAFVGDVLNRRVAREIIEDSE